MQALRSTIERVAGTDFTVLLEGENGQGGLLKLLKEKYDRCYAEERETLEPYMSLIKCKDCGGRRLPL